MHAAFLDCFVYVIVKLEWTLTFKQWGGFDLWQALRNKKVRGLSEGRDKLKDILIPITWYFALTKSSSKAGKHFSIAQNQVCDKSSDVDFIHLNSGTGCAVMVTFPCVSYLNPWTVSKEVWWMSYTYQVFTRKGIVTLPVYWNHTIATWFECFCFCGLTLWYLPCQSANSVIWSWEIKI